MKKRSFAIILGVTAAIFLSTSTSSPEIDQTGNIKILAHGLIFNKSDGTTSYSYHLQNSSQHTLSGPFAVVIEAMNNSDVLIINPDGYTLEGKPYFLYAENQLAPGGNTTDKAWIFDHQCGKKAAVKLSKYTSSGKLVFAKKCATAVTVYYSIASPEQGANHLPVANAGPDQVVHVGAVVELDGSRSTDIDGDLLSYKWSIISQPRGANVTLSDSTSARPSFTAVKAGNYVIQLIVNDGVADSSPDLCTIGTKSLAPVADAGPDQTVSVGDTVTLDGSKSTDMTGNLLAYRWAIISRPLGSNASLSDPVAVRPTFVVDLLGTYTVQLVVYDGKIRSTPSICTITTGNSRPIANAGPDQKVSQGNTVTLNGSKSTDVDGDPLTYQWSILSRPGGSLASLSDPTLVRPSFVADLSGTYVVQLIVKDGTMDSLPRTVVITTGKSRPVADAGPDQTVSVSQTVTLDGSGSSDADGNPLTFRWFFNSVPSGSKAQLSNPTTVKPTFLVDLAGTYVIELIANDGTMDSLPKTVVITTGNSRPVANAGADQNADVGDTVALDGSHSKDSDNDPLSFQWDLVYKPAGSTSVLGSPTATHPSFVPDLAGMYVAQLIVSDGKMESYPDTVTVSAIVSMVTVPNVVGLAQSAAESAITGASLRVGAITTEYSLTVPAGYVISQNPVAGTSVAKRSFVSLDVSLGPPPVTVPNVVGMDQASAESAILAAQLTVGTITSQNSGTVPAGQVISQSPQGGSAAPQGSSVDLWISLGPAIPPDPGTVAPPIDPTVATTVGQSTDFLYTGSNPIQTGVVPGTIEPKRAAVLRGKVLDGNGLPLPAVTVTILNHPEYGQTLSRLDGMFDMVVNGGGLLNVRYEKAGYLTVQRQRDIPWGDFMWLPEVRMIPADPNVTFIDLNAPADFQIIRGSVIADERGTRQSTVLIPKGNQAWMVFPDGHEEPITSLTVRATEYTVGAEGPNKMPAELPPTSAYTYCEEFTVEEAVAAGAPEVRFSQPVISYNENFRNFPVGTGIPLGAYNRERGVWIPSDNGKVIKILSIANGYAELDTDGDGIVDNGISLGITSSERLVLAGLYTAGQSLWRVLVPHFTRPWDKNMGIGCDGPCPDPNTVPPRERVVDQTCTQEGSIIECQNQALGQVADVTGTPFRLYYKSDRVPGRTDAFTLDVPLTSPSMSPKLQAIRLKVWVAGQEIERQFQKGYFDLYSLSDTFAWDGKDAYGRAPQGRQPVSFGIGYAYNLGYDVPPRFGYNGNGTLVTIENFMFVIWKAHKGWIGLWDARGQGLGGWTLDVHHAYDPQEKVVYYGNGRKHSASSIGQVITTVAGGGSPGDKKPATQAFLYNPAAVAFARDGSYYIAEGSLIRRVGPDGIITTAAGTTPGYGGDGGPATAAMLHYPSDVAVGPDGSIYIADTSNWRVRRVGPDGIITTFAGDGTCPCAGLGCPVIPDDVPATQTEVCEVNKISVGADGSLYMLHNVARSVGKYVIRRVGPDGIVSTIASSITSTIGACTNMSEGVRATEANIGYVNSLAVGPDGSIYFGSACSSPSIYGPSIWRVGVDGKLKKVAGNGTQGYSGDGGPALQASMRDPASLAFGPDGSLYFPTGCIRAISPAGLINTVAGTSSCTVFAYGFSGDNGLATQAVLFNPLAATPGPDGNLYVADTYNWRVRRVAPMLPEISESDLLIPSEDGGEIYLFNSQGKHLRTYNALTAAMKYEFGYNGNGSLVTVKDGDGNVTNIERDGGDRPVAIVSPYGQRTTLTLDGNGYLTGISSPAAETSQFAYSGDGLMTDLTDPRGGLYHFTYDNRGRLTGETDPAGGSRTLSLTQTSTSFDVTHTTGMNRTTNYHVDRLGTGDEHYINTFSSGIATDALLKKKDGNESVTFPGGTIATKQLGPDPRFGMQAPVPTSQTIAMPSSLTATVTKARTATLSTPDNPLTLSTLQEDSTINGRKYTTSFTASTKTVTNTSPAGRQMTSKIDSRGRLVEHQVAGFLPVQFAYNPQGRLTSVKQGSGIDFRESTFQYNTQGFLQTVTDPLSQTLSFEYDQAGRLTSQILPDGREIMYAYDANGNMTSLTPPGRPAYAFTYTPVDLLAEYNPPGIGIGTVKTDYSYNTDRQLTLVLRPDGLSTVLDYDTGGRLKDVTYPGGPVTYTYDPAKGYITQISSPGGNSTSYAYDGQLVRSETWAGDVTGQVVWTYDTDFRVTSQSVNGGNAVAYQYDNDSLITKAGNLTLTRSAQNGFLTGSTLGNVTDARTYNSFGEPDSYIAKYGTTEIFKQQFTYDKLGRIAQKIETVEGATNTYDYIYDPTGRLIEVKKNGSTISTYVYDSNDNRSSYAGPGGPVNGTYDNQDRLMQYGTSTYSYSANGELQTKTTGSQTTLYNYDVLGNSRSVTLPDGTVIEYAVDGHNRCVGKKVNSVWVRKFLYLNPLKPVAELDPSDALISLFVYGSRLNVPEYMVKGGATYRIISDHLGSPRLVVDTATGTVIQRTDYDEFGNVISDTNPGFQPFGFAGGLYDPQTGLVRFGARDYDAETGRWTARDPILFGRRGTTNLYRYAMSDPVNLIDPGGKQPTVNIGGRPVELAGWNPPGFEALMRLQKDIAFPMMQREISMSPGGKAIEWCAFFVESALTLMMGGMGSAIGAAMEGQIPAITPGVWTRQNGMDFEMLDALYDARQLPAPASLPRTASQPIMFRYGFDQPWIIR